MNGSTESIKNEPRPAKKKKKEEESHAQDCLERGTSPEGGPPRKKERKREAVQFF